MSGSLPLVSDLDEVMRHAAFPVPDPCQIGAKALAAEPPLRCTFEGQAMLRRQSSTEPLIDVPLPDWPPAKHASHCGLPANSLNRLREFAHGGIRYYRCSELSTTKTPFAASRLLDDLLPRF